MMSASAQPETQPPATAPKPAPSQPAPPQLTSPQPASPQPALPQPALPPSTPSTSIQNAEASTMTTAPPQPPLPPSDPPFTLPDIVHGIDLPEEATPTTTTTNTEPPQLSHQPSMTEVLTSLTARMQRAVRFPTIERLSSPSPNTRGCNPSVLLFGDSHTQLSTTVSDASAAPGWATLLREAFEERVDFQIRGYSGYNSRWAVHILPQVLDTLRKTGVCPTAATILLGSNDAAAGTDPLHIPLEQYAHNLSKMILYLRSNGVTPVLITPPPLGSVDDLLASRTKEAVAKYAEACRRVGRECDCLVVDFHAGLLAGSGKDGVDVFLNDGLHLSSAGNRLLFQSVLKALAEVSSDLVPENRAPVFPPWAEVDPINPADSLGTSELVES